MNRITFLALLLLLAPFPSLATPRSTKPVAILNIVDGDTIRVRIEGDSELVRLIGIDAPESHRSEKAERQASEQHIRIETIYRLGERATQAVRTMVDIRNPVTLEFDVQPRDKYGRLLAYVFLPDGTFLNEKILSLGYAKLLTIPPNVKYRDRLRSAFETGRLARRGLWSMDGFR